ncbi:MAG: hypothetical protein ACYDC6_10335 [Acidobacteriaceae bacterium]
MIEAVHDVLKNELAGGVMPSKYFGANAGAPTDRSSSVEWNAAWLRLAAISNNVLTALKRIALPAELLRARPRRLRLATLEERIALWKKALPAAAGCQSLHERRLRHADRRIFLGRF